MSEEIILIHRLVSWFDMPFDWLSAQLRCSVRTYCSEGFDSEVPILMESLQASADPAVETQGRASDWGGRNALLCFVFDGDIGKRI